MKVVDGHQVVYAAAHSKVGDLVVQDDCDEITLFLGNFHHCHIRNYDERLTD